MRIVLHIGLPFCGAEALQTALDAHRAALARQGVIYPQAPGRANHTRLYMAVSAPDRPDPLRLARGFATAAAQDRLRLALVQDLAAELRRAEGAETLVLSAQQLATLPDAAEVARLQELLRPVSSQVAVVAHVDDQARLLLRHYASALQEGRLAHLGQELAVAAAGGVWDPATLPHWSDRARAATGADCPEVQGVPHWLDYTALQARWEGVFGAGSLTLRPFVPDRFAPGAVEEELCAMLGIAALKPGGKRKETARKDRTRNEAGDAMPATAPSAATLTRWRALNHLLRRLVEKGRPIPRNLWKSLLAEAAVEGPPQGAGALAVIAQRFAADNAALRRAHPALDDPGFAPDPPAATWAEADPGFGFRATQYLAAFLPRIEEAARQGAGTGDKEGLKEGAKAAGAAGPAPQAKPSAIAEALFSDRARQNFHHIRSTKFAPHNAIGLSDEAEIGPDYAPIQPRAGLGPGRTGKVIVGCMKNEAPYILEWVAYHRQVGVDDFLIFTNDCSDGTDAILNRLQEMGVLQHRSNDDWKGNSPQQHALNKAMREPVVQQADWLIHIDVDEFINIRTGNGTLDDFLALVPEATNVAMTWRMFGHNGVTRFEDRLVIGQFDHAAPKYCPKPHTNWGFKTMTRNVGAYAKLACHRPNKPDPAQAARVQWVNGSARKMPASYVDKGWRSELGTIGYDLLQLNHYALRSAESFLVKRQRGRALHVDRSIGLNYWIRMDWSSYPDRTIQRNIARVERERAALLADAELARLHQAGVEWHRAKAAELHATPEFAELYQQALDTKLTDLERVAFALALDMEN